MLTYFLAMIDTLQYAAPVGRMQSSMRFAVEHLVWDYCHLDRREVRKCVGSLVDTTAIEVDRRAYMAGTNQDGSVVDHVRMLIGRYLIQVSACCENQIVRKRDSFLLCCFVP